MRTRTRCARLVVCVCVSLLLLSGTSSAKALHNAAYAGNLAEVKRLIEKGKNVNARDKEGYTPLHMAAWTNERDVAELLIAHGADVNAKNEYGATPLHMAAYDGNKAAAELLIAHGADVNARSKNGGTPLYLALRNVEETVGSTNYDNRDETEVINRTLETMVTLISKGADVNTKGEYDFTALHCALLSNDHRSIAEWLISKGADVNAKTGFKARRIRPLHMATYWGDKEMVELLISKGAEVNVRDSDDSTPLDYAIKYGHTDAAELLRRHGAH